MGKLETIGNCGVFTVELETITVLIISWKLYGFYSIITGFRVIVPLSHMWEVNLAEKYYANQ